MLGFSRAGRESLQYKTERIEMQRNLDGLGFRLDANLWMVIQFPFRTSDIFPIYVLTHCEIHYFHDVINFWQLISELRIDVEMKTLKHSPI